MFGFGFFFFIWHLGEKCIFGGIYTNIGSNKIKISNFTIDNKLGNYDFIRSHISVNSSKFPYYSIYTTQIPYEK